MSRPTDGLPVHPVQCRSEPSVSDTINDIVKSASVNLKTSASGGVGAFTWSVNGELPDGLS